MKYSFLLFTLLLCSSLINAQAEYGKASFYADKFNGNKTANGERFDQGKMTAAHRTLPFDTWVKVTNLNNQKSVIVRINDRGPFVKGVVVDLSKAAAVKLDMVKAGVVNVKMEIVEGKPKDSRSKPTNTIDMGNKPTAKKPIAPPKPQLGRGGKGGKDTNLYRVSVDQIALENYGVQVGSYAQYQNILAQISSIQRKVEKECMVYVGKGSDGGALYKLIIGPISSKTAAENYLASLKRQSINGFVVDLSQIK